MTDPWELAHGAASRAGVALVPLTSLADGDRVLDVMVETWGDFQVLPREVVRALGHSGNVPFGAVDEEGQLVGFVLGWAGVDGDGLHVHSHMLATRPSHRHGGVGFALKLAQRAQALEQRIGVVRWTFDPLVARNAYFNLSKLGAVVDRFERDFYGEMTDELNRGDRSDRGVIRWDLEREPGPRGVALEDADVVLRRGDDGGPGTSVAPSGAVALVEIPAEYDELRRRDRYAARPWRDAVAGAFEGLLARGFVATGFERGASAYVFSRAGAA